jgi:DNA-binding NarL/FixJ family response regulator
VARDLPARSSPPVLVVCADEAARQAHLAAIRAAGRNVVGAGTCDEALRIAARVRLRAVVFDVVDTADWFHCRRLCASMQDAPVVVLSSACTPDRWYRSMAQRIGCSGFVVKPCQPAVLVDALRRACAGEPWVEYMG